MCISASCSSCLHHEHDNNYNCINNCHSYTLFITCLTSYVLQDTTTPKDAGAEMCTAQPCVVVRGSLEDMKDAFLVVENKVLCKIPLGEVALALISAFYVFNMHYPHGCYNFYTFIECMFMGKKTPSKKKNKVIKCNH